MNETKSVVITDTYDMDVFNHLKETLAPDNSDEQVHEYMLGDMWIDCDFIITPKYILYFVTMEINDTVYMVFNEFPDDGIELQVTKKFADSLKAGIYKIVSELKDSDFDTFLPNFRKTNLKWEECVQLRARERGEYIVCYRGGVGYSYYLYAFDSNAEQVKDS